MVTVVLAMPFAVMPELGEPEIVEFVVEGAPATKVTVEVTVVRPAGAVMARVFAPAAVDLIVPVATPEAFVTEAGCTSAFPVPVAEKVTVCPAIGLP